ncbi:MAG: HAD family hydrolase [Lachnospiraceae bacterium]|nr:HAD family hydrolase [Lachnospiraceae bacterium]
MNQYEAVFFDWDGTAVLSRRAPADDAAAAMRPLLEKGVKLVVVSGTTIENIAGGRLGDYFTEGQLKNLYLGLGRGAHNYAFRGGEPYVFADRLPDMGTLEAVHRTAFEVHMELKREYGLDTDIVFSRPNYCKIDLSVSHDRGESLFMQGDEPERLRELLSGHGIRGGLSQLIQVARRAGERNGVFVKATCDAKYLEVGISDKSDNVDAILGRLSEECGVRPERCAYFGDEFIGIEPGIFGSDSFMRTERTKEGDFFDVSDMPGERPEGVRVLGGGVRRFLSFLEEQSRE